MRFALPMSLRVMTNSLPPSSPNHTGVATPTPVLRNVVSEIYFCPAIAGETWLAIVNIVAGLRGAIVNELVFAGGVQADIAGSQVALWIALIL